MINELVRKKFVSLLIVLTLLCSIPVVAYAEGEMLIAVDTAGESGQQIVINETSVSIPLKVYAGADGNQFDQFDASLLQTSKNGIKDASNSLVENQNCTFTKIGTGEDGYCFVNLSAENLSPGTAYVLFIKKASYGSWSLNSAYKSYTFETPGSGYNYIQWGDNQIDDHTQVQVIYYSNGTIELGDSGSGIMSNWTASAASPWASNYSYYYVLTKSIDVKDGVKHIGNYTFSPMPNLTTVTTGYLDPLTSIGEYAFKGCTSLRDVYLYADADAMDIASTAFDGCSDVTIHVTCGQLAAYQTKFAELPNVTFTGPEHTWDDGVVSKEATVDAEGEKTFTCSVCGETKTEAIDKLEPAAEEPAAEPAAEEPAAPKIIEGAGQKAEAGKPATFRADIDFADFAGIVKVDGKVVDKSNYDAKEGSTIITLHADFVKTLGAGNHTIAILSKNGTQAESTFSVAEEETIANTDGPVATQVSPMLIMFVISALGGVAIVVLTSTKKEKYTVL